MPPIVKGVFGPGVNGNLLRREQSEPADGLSESSFCGVPDPELNCNIRDRFRPRELQEIGTAEGECYIVLLVKHRLIQVMA